MQLLCHKLLVVCVFNFLLLSSIVSSDKIIVISKDGEIPFVIEGTKTHISKLTKVVLSEEKIFASLDKAKSIQHFMRILNDTGLFERVTLASNSSDNNINIKVKDAYTLLPILDFSTNLQNFSYTAGISESDLFNDYWFASGAWSQSKTIHDLFYSFGVAYPTSFIQSISLGGLHGDNFFYYTSKWYRFDFDDVYLNIRFKNIWENQKLTYGLQLRYSQFEFNDEPTLSTSVFVNIGKIYSNHDISEGYQFGSSFRYIEDRYNKYAWINNFQKNWYVPFKQNDYFRGTNIDFHTEFSNIPKDRSVVGTVFSSRNGSLHGLRSNSVFERNFGTASMRIGVTSRKFLWTYWQPHVFLECGFSNHETYYSVGGGILLTFPAFYNSRLRIQYYCGELPDKVEGIIISTTLDF